MTYSILFSSHRLLKILEAMALVAVLFSLFWPRLAGGPLRQIEQHMRKYASSPSRAILTAALFPMIVRLAMLPWYPPPPPQIHDEFSYLLQADTFAHGRVTNPPPPYWKHFETEYVLFQPSYASQYQPAQGIVLALGQVIFGHPWWGVWLSMGVLSGLICWALGYVMPPAWALAGALGASLQFGIFGIWMNSYFGGAVAASAGALVFGAVARMRRKKKVAASGALCAAGIIVLFASRPFEALLWSAAAAPFLFRDRRALPLFVTVFVFGATALAWYNWRVTGNALDPPYLSYQRLYGTPQPYWWQPPVRVSDFDFPEIRNNYLNQLRLYEQRHSLPKIVTAERDRLAHFWRFFIGPFFTPALLFVPFVFRDRRVRPWLFASILFIADKATYHAWFPAQNAPATILIVLVLLQAWRHMRVWNRRRGTGLAMSRLMVAGICLTIILGNAGRAAEPLLPQKRLTHLAPIWESLYPARRLRDDVSNWLERIPGRHLVFVKYQPGHCFCEEWVFNMADIREQRIVYARPYTPESDEALAQTLQNYDVWLAEPDAHPFRLSRVSPTEFAHLAPAVRASSD